MIGIADLALCPASHECVMAARVEVSIGLMFCNELQDSCN